MWRSAAVQLLMASSGSFSILRIHTSDPSAVARSGKKTLKVKLRPGWFRRQPVKRLQKQREGMRVGEWSIQ